MVKAFKVVEVSANKASAVINTDFRKAIEVLGQTSAAAAAAGRSTKFYEAQVESLTRKLNAQTAAQAKANREAEYLAKAQAKFAMGQRLGPKQTAAVMAASAAGTAGSADDGIVRAALVQASTRELMKEHAAKLRADKSAESAARGERIKRRVEVRRSHQEELDEQNRAFKEANMARYKSANVAYEKEIGTGKADRERVAADREATKSAAISRGLAKRKTHDEAVSEYEATQARKSAGAAAYAERAKNETAAASVARGAQAKHRAEVRKDHQSALDDQNAAVKSENMARYAKARAQMESDRIAGVDAASRSIRARALMRARTEERAQAAAVAKQEAHDEAVQTRLKRMQVGQRLRASAAERARLAYEDSILGRLRSGLGSIGGVFFNRFMGAGAVVGAVYQGAKLIKDSISVDIQMQRMVNTLKQASGSAVAAESDMQFLRAASDKIGFSFLQAGGDFARFTVAAKSSNLTTKETRTIFRQMQEAAAVMGLSTERTSEAMLALEQMLSKGTVMSQELRIQLGNAMPGSMAIFARALGVSQGELMKLVEEGLVPASSAVKLFGLEMERAFTLTDEANKTQRDIVRMTNAINEMKAAIGEEIRPGVSRGTEAVSGLANFFTDPLLWMQLHPGRASGDVPIGGGRNEGTGFTGEEQAAFFQRTFDMQDAVEKKMRAKRLAGQKKAQDDAKKEREKAGVEKTQAKVSEIDTKREELTRKHSNEMLTDEAKLTALRKQQSDLANFILNNRKQMTPVMEAQAKLDLEELHGEVDRAQRGQNLGGHYEKTSKSHRGSGMILTDQERHGGSLGAGVSLLDVNKQQLKVLHGIHRAVSRKGGGGLAPYLGGSR